MRRLDAPKGWAQPLLTPPAAPWAALRLQKASHGEWCSPPVAYLWCHLHPAHNPKGIHH